MKMMSKPGFRLPKKFRAILIFIVIILVAYLLIRMIPTGAQKVPKEFLEARANASPIAQDIVNNSNDLTKSLDQVAQFDSEKKYTEAINFLTKEIDRNKDINQKAIKLSEELGKMATAVPNISPASASQLALQAISSETTLISRLIVYNGYLGQLLEELRLKFLGQKTDGQTIKDLIGKINDEVKNINALNVQFNSSMDKLDGGK
ncbi:MAG: hypothetical protein WC297_00205 [Candidatus Paceibacterota bacterium]|jgi:hypothetical protein